MKKHLGGKVKKAIKVIIWISFIFYLFALIFILFLKTRGYADDISFIEYMKYIKYSINIFPFKTISTYIKALFNGNMNMNIPLENLGGNLILFLPMGIYLPFLIKKMNSLKSYSIFMISLLFSVEIIQLITRRGSFDIDDIILNMLGAFIGFMIWKTKLVQKLLNDKLKEV